MHGDAWLQKTCALRESYHPPRDQLADFAAETIEKGGFCCKIARHGFELGRQGPTGGWGLRTATGLSMVEFFPCLRQHGGRESDLPQ